MTDTTASDFGVRRVSNSTAVQVKDAVKTYGRGRKQFVALNGLHMNVRHGSIYGLLGPSGCGKTTLLGCLVNHLKLDAGKITIFGFSPGTPESAVPGSRVGYMPQELALFQELTFDETMQYFGRLHRMNQSWIQERAAFLLTFLDLPSSSRLISQMSGGQQRRISLAAALLHEPQLLILDEPTVGVDPLLRTNIWKHLMEVSSRGETTIIITTHYVEEARQADQVGLMRCGKLLAEAPPNDLMEYYGFNSLETVFLKLCLNDPQQQEADSQNVPATDTDKEKGPPLSACLVSQPLATSSLQFQKTGKDDHVLLTDRLDGPIFTQRWVASGSLERFFSFARCFALLVKSLIRLKRHMGFLAFSFLVPPIQTILFCLAIGGLPRGLDLAVVNLDDPPKAFMVDELRVSDIYLHHLNPQTIDQKLYDTFDLGYQSVVEGKTYGMIFFNETYSSDIIKSFLIPMAATSGNAAILAYLDTTNPMISWSLQVSLLTAFRSAIEDIQTELGGNIVPAFSLPIHFQSAVYGTYDPSFTNFMAPGVILSITFFMAMGLTALSFIMERKEGLLERSWVAGVQPGEVMLSHLGTQMLVMLVQITLILVLMFPLFDVPCEGSMVLVVVLSILQGLCGMTFGLMISTLAEDEVTAVQIIIGMFYPIFLLSGIVWPVQGMPDALRYISYIMPQTIPCESMRAILYKAWGLDHFIVYMGYIITIFWTLCYLVIAAIAIRLKK